MPKSKKPRKHFVSGRHPMRILGVERAKIDDVKNSIELAELAVRIKLPRGEASFNDLSQVRHLYNCLAFSLMHRQSVIDQKEADESLAVLYQAATDLSTVIDRGSETGHYVCRASEMRSILSALQTASDFCNDSIETCSQIFIAEFNAALLLKESLPYNREIDVDKKTGELAYRLSQQILNVREEDFPAWKKQAVAFMKNHINQISKKEQKND